MKVLIYVNREKDPNNCWLENLKNLLSECGIEFEVITRNDLGSNKVADALLVLGGDGTILDLTGFSNRNNIPIVGINAGKLGFLTEFEKFETADAVHLLKDKSLSLDERATMKVSFGGKSYYALNDVVVQRFFGETRGMVINVEVSVSGSVVDKIVGDGVIICTPTGSTAYSLSAGGAILAPGINAFSITPIAAHSLSHRPIIYSAEQECNVILKSGEKSCVFVDGKFLGYMHCGEMLTINKSERSTPFLRKKTFNFFQLLNKKMIDGNGGSKND